MADPRFFKNLGPFSLAQICEKIGIAIPPGCDGAKLLFDLADLAGAGTRHVTFYSGSATLRAVGRSGKVHARKPQRRRILPEDGLAEAAVASLGAEDLADAGALTLEQFVQAGPGGLQLSEAGTQ